MICWQKGPEFCTLYLSMERKSSQSQDCRVLSRCWSWQLRLETALTMKLQLFWSSESMNRQMRSTILRTRSCLIEHLSLLQRKKILVRWVISQAVRFCSTHTSTRSTICSQNISLILANISSIVMVLTTFLVDRSSADSRQVMISALCLQKYQYGKVRFMARMHSPDRKQCIGISFFSSCSVVFMNYRIRRLLDRSVLARYISSDLQWAERVGRRGWMRSTNLSKTEITAHPRSFPFQYSFQMSYPSRIRSRLSKMKYISYSPSWSTRSRQRYRICRQCSQNCSYSTKYGRFMQTISLQYESSLHCSYLELFKEVRLFYELFIRVFYKLFELRFALALY